MPLIKAIINKGIIEPRELASLLNSEQSSSIKLIDGTFTLPGAGEDPYQGFLRRRIGNAVFFDIDQISDHDSDLPHMLPAATYFEQAVSKLGITNNDLVVIYGQAGMIMGPARVWWMFRALGHDRVCVLNGGLPAWIVEGYPLDTALPAAPAPSIFKAQLNGDYIRTLEDMKSIVEADHDNKPAIFDARPGGRFNGSVPEPRPGMRSGHIPGSQNIPCVNLITHETGKLKPEGELQDIFKSVGYESGKPVITTCGSGVTACVIALALFHIGEKNVPVYDGSWSEWGQASSPTSVATQ